MRKFLGDLFKNVGNESWDLARILSFWAVISTSGLAGYKLYQGQDLSITEYATAMMTILAGCTIFIAGKDVARAGAIKMAPSAGPPPNPGGNG